MTTNLNIRIDSDVKSDAEMLYRELGLSLSAAINMFLRQSIRVNGLPFELRLHPNAATLAAMQEADDIMTGRRQAKRYSSAKELFDELDAEMDEEDADV